MTRAEIAGIDRWLRPHAGLVFLGVATVWLAIRVLAISGSYLTADEATHFELVNVPLADVYRSTLNEAHPPLFFLLLHLWRLVDNSEFWLRLLPVLLGAMFLWAAYQWVRRLLGTSEALFTLGILAFSPALTALLAEVRGYSLLLLLMVSALFVLERAIETRSARGIGAFSLLLYLAILTHYAALWFTLAVFAYVLVRVRMERLPAKFFLTCLASLVGAGVLYASLYLTHFARLRGGELERHAITRWLRAEYFHSDQEGVLVYLGRQTFGLFRSLLGSGALAYLGLLLALTGVAVLARRRRPIALLLVFPALVGAAAGIAGVYPYGGTRHSVYLFLFAAAAIGAAGSAATRGRLWPPLLLMIVLAAVLWSTKPLTPNRSIPHMEAAVRALRSAAPPGSLLFADSNAGAVLSYYLGRDELNREEPGRAGFRENDAGGYRLIRSPVWSFNEKRFASELRRFIDVYRPPSGRTVWLVRLGSEYDPSVVLSREEVPVVPRSQIRFGEISIFELVNETKYPQERGILGSRSRAISRSAPSSRNPREG